MIAAALATLLCVSPTTPALAQSSADKAAAEALFTAAGQLMRAGRYEEACAKLEECVKLDPTGPTYHHLARCYEKTERLASAWASYLEAAAEAKRVKQDAGPGSREATRAAAREAASTQRAKVLQWRLSTLTITVDPELRQLAGLAIERDGKPVGPGAWDTAVPADGGHHRVNVTANGCQPWSTTVYVKPQQDAVEVRVPLLEPQDEPEPEPTSPEKPPPPADEASEPDSSEPGLEFDLGPVFWTGVGVAGLGLVVGTVTGAVSLSQTSSLQDQCIDGVCFPAQHDDLDATMATGHASTAAFVVAGAGAAVALLGMFVFDREGADEPATEAAGVRLLLTPGLAGVSGEF